MSGRGWKRGLVDLGHRRLDRGRRWVRVVVLYSCLEHGDYAKISIYRVLYKLHLFLCSSPQTARRPKQAGSHGQRSFNGDQHGYHLLLLESLSRHLKSDRAIVPFLRIVVCSLADYTLGLCHSHRVFTSVSISLRGIKSLTGRSMLGS
jgi:hypothetical protein